MAVEQSLVSGDRVNLPSNVRLDNPDATALGYLPYEWAAHAIAALLGPCSGSFNKITFDPTTLAAVAIGACHLCYVRHDTGTDGDSELASAQFLRHDPTASSQVSTINLAPYAAGSETPYIWARRVPILMDEEDRRLWDELLEDETAEPTLTRSRDRVTWGVGNAEPTGDDGWFKVARVVSWSGGVPSFVTFHPWYSSTSVALNVANGAGESWLDISSPKKIAGLAVLVETILTRLKEITGDTLGWNEESVAGKSLATLYAGLQRVKARRPLIPVGLAARLSGSWGTSNANAGLLIDEASAEAIVPLVGTQDWLSEGELGAARTVEIGAAPGSAVSITIELRSVDITAAPPTATLEASASWAAGTGYAVKTIAGGSYSSLRSWFLRIQTTGSNGGSTATIYYAVDLTDV